MLEWEGCRRLAAVVLWSALQEDDDEFLLSSDCMLYCEILGWHPDYFRRLLVGAKSDGIRKALAGRYPGNKSPEDQ